MNLTRLASNPEARRFIKPGTFGNVPDFRIWYFPDHRENATMNNYYVYVYIDPRNFEEFYYGKGKGSRKRAHLDDVTNSRKTRQIAEIRKEGLEPLVRVIAKDLTEDEAFLVEKTLLWKLGRWTTNESTGHFQNKFRPKNTLHKELSDFDFQSGTYYYNVGEGPSRNWDDYRRFGFISGGQGARWRDAMLGFKVGDIVVAYRKRRGFVGVGQIRECATAIKDVKRNGKPLLELPLRCKDMSQNSDDPEQSEYVAIVDWIKSVPRSEAKWRRGLYTTPLVRASLDNQSATLRFIEKEFDICVKDLIV